MLPRLARASFLFPRRSSLISFSLSYHSSSSLPFPLSFQRKQCIAFTRHLLPLAHAARYSLQSQTQTPPTLKQAEEYFQEGFKHYKQQKFTDSLNSLASAYEIYSQLGDDQRRMVIGPLIISLCEEMGTPDKATEILSKYAPSFPLF